MTVHEAAHRLGCTESDVCYYARHEKLLRGKYRITRDDDVVHVSDAWGRPVDLARPDVDDLIDTLRAIVHVDDDSERAVRAMRAVAEGALRRNGAAPF